MFIDRELHAGGCSRSALQKRYRLEQARQAAGGSEQLASQPSLGRRLAARISGYLVHAFVEFLDQVVLRVEVCGVGPLAPA